MVQADFGLAVHYADDRISCRANDELVIDLSIANHGSFRYDDLVVTAEVPELGVRVSAPVPLLGPWESISLQLLAGKVPVAATDETAPYVWRGALFTPLHATSTLSGTVFTGHRESHATAYQYLPTLELANNAALWGGAVGGDLTVSNNGEVVLVTGTEEPPPLVCPDP